MTYPFRARRRRMMSTVVLAVAAGFLGMAPATAVPAVDHEPAAKARSVCPSASPGFVSCAVSATVSGSYVWNSTMTTRLRKIEAAGSVECVDSTLSGGTVNLRILYKRPGQTAWSAIVYRTHQISPGGRTAYVNASRTFKENEARPYFRSQLVYDITCANGGTRQSFSGTKTSAEVTIY